MKRVTMLAILGAVAVITSLVAQPSRSTPTKDFMREKLDHSKRVLEGISIGNIRKLS